MARDTTPHDTDEPSDELLRQYEAVRQSEVSNMLDRHAIHRFAREAGMDELSEAAADRSRSAAILEHYQRHGRPTEGFDPGGGS